LVLFQGLLFALFYNLPYDFSTTQIGGGRAGRAFIRSYLGLDLPLWEQYMNWLTKFLRFDLGSSYMAYPTPVSQLLLERAPRTLLLFLTAAVLAYLFGIWLGKMIAWNRGGVFEAWATLGGVAAYTSFAPFLGFVVLNVFGWYLRWFPYQRLVSHYTWLDAPITVDALLVRLVFTAVLFAGSLFFVGRLTRDVKSRLWRWGIRLAILIAVSTALLVWWDQSGFTYLALDVLDHLVLPLGTVTLLSFGETMLLMRVVMIETLQDDFVLTARAKGLSDKVIRDRHVARNAILPVLTRLLLNLPFVLVGSLVIELVFHWNGMGILIFNAIEVVDIPVLMGILSFVGVITLCAHVILDIVYVFLDPRLRSSGVAN
jgi:peptide/nickel transport system permease protein